MFSTFWENLSNLRLLSSLLSSSSFAFPAMISSLACSVSNSFIPSVSDLGSSSEALGSTELGFEVFESKLDMNSRKLEKKELPYAKATSNFKSFKTRISLLII